MTAAMRVAEPIPAFALADAQIFETSGRPERNAQQAVIEVEELMFRRHSEVVDVDLADYHESSPYADLLKSVARRVVDRQSNCPHPLG